MVVVVGTGMEYTVAKDSGSTLIARREGIVDQLDANRVVIRVTDKKDNSLNSGRITVCDQAAQRHRGIKWLTT